MYDFFRDFIPHAVQYDFDSSMSRLPYPAIMIFGDNIGLQGVLLISAGATEIKSIEVSDTEIRPQTETSYQNAIP